MLRQSCILAAAALAGSAFAQVSDDFESGLSTTVWDTAYQPQCTGGGTVTLDSTVAHSGKNSVKVTGGPSGFCGHIFFGTTNVPKGNDLYTRFWVRPQTALGSDHVTFMVFPDASMTGTNNHLRFGDMQSVLMYNRESDDAALPDFSPAGVASSVALPALTWSCLEQHIAKDGTIETWLNGNSVVGLNAGPTSTNPNMNGWGKAYKPSLTGAYFGWESYGGSINTFWYDDVSIQSTRIGCGASTGASAPAPGTTLSTATKPAAPITTAAPAPAPTTTAAPAPAPAPTTSAAPAPAPAPSSCAAAMYGQCGGIGWSGCTTCVSGATCKASGSYYSQCLA